MAVTVPPQAASQCPAPSPSDLLDQAATPHMLLLYTMLLHYMRYSPMDQPVRPAHLASPPGLILLSALSLLSLWDPAPNHLPTL